MFMNYFKFLILLLLFCSCSATKQKADVEFSEQIETKEFRKGDTVTYIVPNIKYKDTIITTVSRQGTTLKTYYDKSGNISKADCIGAEIELLRSEMRQMNGKSITKEKGYFENPLLWLIIALAVVVLLKK